MNKIDDERNKSVVQANELIMATHDNMTAQEKKLIVYIISKVNPSDSEFYTIKIKFKDYCECMNIVTRGSKAAIKKSLKTLSDKSWWINKGADEEILFRWIESPVIKGSTIEIKLKNELKPFLLGLQEKFTKYNLINVLLLDSKYTIRLYEILKCNLWTNEYYADIETLRNLLGVKDKYKEYRDFNRYVLKNSVQEINKKTDLQVEYDAHKDGKRVVGIIFKIHSENKKSTDERTETALYRYKKLTEQL